jgi:hypothetical protein
MSLLLVVLLLLGGFLWLNRKKLDFSMIEPILLVICVVFLLLHPVYCLIFLAILILCRGGR